MNLQERIDYLTTMAADIVAQLTELSMPEEQEENAQVVSPPPLTKKKKLLASSRPFVNPTH